MQEKIEKCFLPLGIERGSGFVGNQQFGMPDQGARCRHTLLLSDR